MSAIQQLLTDHIDIWTAADTEKKSGRGRSSGNAASVYGIRKLRELILELAVRGKLVPQDQNDEPASELLKRIRAEKAKLIAEGKIRKGQPLSPISEQEKPFDLPCGWDLARLGQIGDWGAGATPLRSVSSYYGGKTPWFKSGELTADLISSSEETITELALKECSLRLNQPGDVLIAMYGATIGKTAILKVPGTTNQAVCACTPNTGIFNRYLLVLLKATKSNFIGQGAGGAQPNISREKIVSTIVAIPSTEEQHRIVAKVDELMALCDQLETRHSNATEAHEKLVSHLLGTLTQSQSAADFSANWQRIAAHFDTLFTTEASIDALKQTLLQLAVMGKLVPQDPKEEPASELLKRIQAEKASLIAEGKIKKDKPLSEISEEERPFDLPKNWEWVRLEDLMPEFQNGASSRGDTDGESVVVLRLADIKDRCISLAEPRELLISPNMIDKYRLLIGDILIVRVNGSADLVGGFIVCEHHFDGIYCDHFIRMRVSQDILNPKFLALVGVSQLVRDRIKDLFITTAGQKTVNQGHIGSLLIPLLNLAEQHRIVAKVDELMALCDQLKSRIAAASQLQHKLAEVLVEQAVA